MQIEEIARIAHETNREYCKLLGDHSQEEWDDAPEWQQQSAINGVQFHLDILRGDPQHGHVSVGPIHAGASHENWLRLKRSQGWVYGPVKDPDAKEHPCLVPFSELPKDQQAKDYLFAAIVRAFYEAGVAPPGRSATGATGPMGQSA